MNLFTSKKLLALLSATIFLLGCSLGFNFSPFSSDEQAQSSSRPGQLVLDKPYSTFVPSRNTVQAEVGKPLRLESRHVGPAPLQQVTIAINDPADVDGNATTFPSALAIVRVLSADPPLITDVTTPPRPTKDWTLSLEWVGFTPGTYNLTLQATDTAGKGDPVTQQIEVR